MKNPNKKVPNQVKSVVFLKDNQINETVKNKTVVREL
jgi:hypothetical protein